MVDYKGGDKKWTLDRHFVMQELFLVQELNNAENRFKTLLKAGSETHRPPLDQKRLHILLSKSRS